MYKYTIIAFVVKENITNFWTNNSKQEQSKFVIHLKTNKPYVSLSFKIIQTLCEYHTNPMRVYQTKSTRPMQV